METRFCFKNSPSEVKKIIGKILQGGLSIGTRCCRAGGPGEGCHRGQGVIGAICLQAGMLQGGMSGARCLGATCHRALIITQVGEN